MTLNRIFSALYRKAWYFFYKTAFKNLGLKSYVQNALHIMGKNNIYIGENVFVAYKSWLAAVPDTNSELCELIIGNGTRIGNFNHIYATKSIRIGNNVLTADKVYISDNLHGYEDVNVPILNQHIKQLSTVEVGDGTWLGENVCVIGAKIGTHCVIGANSVITKDIPDYSVVVGSPGRIIKRYCFEKKEWLKTNKLGNFI